MGGNQAFYERQLMLQRKVVKYTSLKLDDVYKKWQD